MDLERYRKALTLLHQGKSYPTIKEETGVNEKYLGLIKKWVVEGPFPGWKDEEDANKRAVYRIMTALEEEKRKLEEKKREARENSLTYWRILAEEKSLLYNSCVRRLSLAHTKIRRLSTALFASVGLSLLLIGLLVVSS
jgi:hypothetical protein